MYNKVAVCKWSILVHFVQEINSANGMLNTTSSRISTKPSEPAGVGAEASVESSIVWTPSKPLNG